MEGIHFIAGIFKYARIQSLSCELLMHLKQSDMVSIIFFYHLCYLS